MARGRVRLPAPAQEKPGDQEVVEQIRALKGEHPFGGYRRVWTWLRYREGRPINKKRGYRLMKAAGLLREKQAPGRPKGLGGQKPSPTRPHEWWGIELTKVLPKIGWVSIVWVLDWFTREVVGWRCALRATTAVWKAALEAAVQTACPLGSRGESLHLMSDNGSHPPSQAFIATGAVLGIEQAFTAFNNPKGNADTEWWARTLKEEVIWLKEWESYAELEAALEAWIPWDNAHYPHSRLGYRSPQMVREAWTPCKLAA